MSEISLNNKRIAKNTLLLYFRMLLTMVVSLYTSRIVLGAMGVDDYGIYNVVGGVVAMFSVLSGSLSAAISRFITFELGKGNVDNLKKVFSSAVTIQIGLSILIVILAETIGLWFLNNEMVIPMERMIAANWVYQFSILTFVVNLISVPYNAAIIAHEKMSVFAYISILEVIGKLIVAFSIAISPIDKLIFYGSLLMMIAFLIRIIYGYYCKKHFIECTYHFVFNRSLLRQMFGFAGWNFIGSSAGVLRTQGLNILINLFYGVSVNAARGISVQVNMAVSSFATNFMTALNPQITKSYASGNFDYLHDLLYKGARFSFYLLLVLSLPVLIETETILFIWLGMVPEYTIGFVRYILIFTLIEAISAPLITAMLATGNIKKYQILAGGTNLLNIPVSYLLLKVYGFETFPEISIVVAIFFSVICFIQRLFLLKDMIRLQSVTFIKCVILNVFWVTIVSLIIPLLMHYILPYNIYTSFGIMMISVVCTIFCIYFLGCSQQEKAFINNKIKLLYNKIYSKNQ